MSRDFSTRFTAWSFIAAAVKWSIMPSVVGWMAVAIGLAAMGLTMLLPDHMSLYMPVFHALSLWLLLVGIVLLRTGLCRDATE